MHQIASKQIVNPADRPHLVVADLSCTAVVVSLQRSRDRVLRVLRCGICPGRREERINISLLELLSHAIFPLTLTVHSRQRATDRRLPAILTAFRSPSRRPASVARSRTTADD